MKSAIFTIFLVSVLSPVFVKGKGKFKSSLKTAYDSALIDAGIQVKKYPKILQVHFDNLKVTRPGELLNPRYSRVLEEQPTYLYFEREANKFYTLLMLDIDAPSKIKPTNWCHWGVANINGSFSGKASSAAEAMEGMFENSSTFLKYKGPAPVKGSGLHRYLFLVYEQSNELKKKFVLNQLRYRWRGKFKIEKMLVKNPGKLVAANMFKMEN